MDQGEKDLEGQSAHDSTSKDFHIGEVNTVGRWQNFKDSFKRADIDDPNLEGLSEVEKAAIMTAKSPLNRALKGRHIQMIAIGGSIGTGLFVGSGGSLSTGGPASLLIGFFLIGTMLFCTVHALGELAVRFPVAGSFATYATRFVDPAWGFAMGWNYVLQWIVAFPLELVAAGMTIQFWKDDGNGAATVNPAAWVSLFYVLVVAINFFGARGYGEAEFILSIIKVIAVIGFCILGVVIDCGGGPNGGYIGGQYWHDPGAFAAGFKGLCSVFVNAAFAFSGTELVGLAAAETKNPRKSLPSAIKQVFWRILLFYLVSLTIVGLLVPYNDESLLNSSSSVDVTASPFVIAIKNAGISGLPSVFNVVVLISVLSVGNSSVYGSSRTIAALGAQGQAPRIFGYIDRAGRPLVGLIITVTFGLICFVCAAGQETEENVFNWLLAISALSSLFTWASVCYCHIRFRAGMKAQGRSLDELAFKSGVGVLGSWYGLLMNILVLIAQFWTALFPLGEKPSAEAFFEVYLAFPICLVCYVGYKAWYRPPFVKLADMDLDTGSRRMDPDVLQQELEEERQRIRAKGWWFRVYKFWC
uniref:ARAD1A19228p n=1 Tax=Blastobotrys adeninivorans TaxID=409370 RepID=A0A060SZB3_BLAAD